MDKSLAHSLAWRAATNWGSQLLAWGSLFVVVRLLAPADFGLAAMAVVLWPYLRYLGEFGVPQTVVTMRDLTDDQLGQLNTISLLLGLATFAVSIVLARPLALFFRTPALVPVVIITCLQLIPQGFRAVPEGLLNKDMRFGLLSWIEAIRAVVAALATLVMAYLGYGYWALVWGNLIGTVVRTAIIMVARPFRFTWPRIAGLQKALTFGWHVLVSVIAWSAYERLDNVTAGRVLGQAALGAYAMAWNLANVPLEKVTSLVTTIIPSYFAAVQTEPAELRRYLRTLTEALAVATFPATIGLALIARELVPLAMGQKWEAVVAPLEVLSVYVAFRSVVALLPKVLTAVGNARFVMWNDLAALVILPTSFYIGSRWGIRGIAWGWVAAYPFVAVPLYWKTFRTISMQVGDYLRSLLPALNCTLGMVIAVGLVKWAVPTSQSLLLRLCLEVLVGTAAYVATLWLLYRERVIAFYRIAKSFRS
jgi:teichuronic acid exporter